MKIYKHKVESLSFTIPNCRKALSVGLQHNNIVIWFLHDEYANDLGVEVFMTGGPYNSNFDNFIGTVQLNDIVYHFFTV